MYGQAETTAELGRFGATPPPRPPSDGKRVLPSGEMFLMVWVFQLQYSLKAFLTGSFGRTLT